MVVFAVIVPIIFSGVMEYLQYLLTSYRTGDFDDFVFNTIGVVVASVFSLFVTRPYMVKREKSKRGDS
jgi:VanZ family protein